MCLCMMPVSIFVSRLDITDLVNKIKTYTNLMKLFHFKIYLFKKNSSLRKLTYFYFKVLIFSSF